MGNHLGVNANSYIVLCQNAMYKSATSTRTKCGVIFQHINRNTSNSTISTSLSFPKTTPCLLIFTVSNLICYLLKSSWKNKISLKSVSKPITNCSGKNINIVDFVTHTRLADIYLKLHCLICQKSSLFWQVFMIISARRRGQT